MQSLVTPKQVARALQVSESSVKRWCDRGIIPAERTAGGHRRIAVSTVVEFLRSTDRTLARPEDIGLPASSGESSWGLDRTRTALTDALVDGEEAVCRQLIFDLYLAGRSVYSVLDEVVTPSMRDIGERWAHGEAKVYEERRGCEICLRLLRELRAVVPVPAADAPIAIGGTPSNDIYSLPTSMIELCLRAAGWNATSLGSNLPFETLTAAMHKHRPRLFWLSVSYVEDTATFIEQYRSFREAFEPSTALIVGGRVFRGEVSLPDELGKPFDDLRSLVEYSETLVAPSPN